MAGMEGLTHFLLCPLHAFTPEGICSQQSPDSELQVGLHRGF